jgi:hypothetical protein
MIVHCTRAHLAVLIAALVLASACGSQKKSGRQSCDVDQDCAGGVCFEEECFSSCKTQAQCKQDEFCVRKVGSDGVAEEVCVVQSEYLGCLQDVDCAELVAGVCEMKGCDQATTQCFVKAKAPGTSCPLDDSTTGVCADRVCQCVPKCDNRECGPDGCGGFCGEPVTGECPGAQDVCEDGRCKCQPDCEAKGKDCGSDGCGGLCGTLEGECPGHQDKCVEGHCTCQPACEGKDCGPDGCGGFCSALADGACPGPQDKCVSGQCVCQPACDGKDCGPDGCDGFCGELEGGCPGPQDACVEGECRCQPACDGLECGPDGCGGHCGELEEGACGGSQDACIEGLCVCQPACDGKDCGPDGCGSSCGQLQGGCAGAQDACIEGLCVCQPACDGKDCGPDGCGGSCGQLQGGCAGAQDVCADGVCTCVPECDGRECGDDGCGGQCGACKACKACTAQGQCVLDPCCNIPIQGCCQGETLRICSNKTIQQVDCDTAGPSCGWNPLAAVYSCFTAGGAEPTGEFPIGCPPCIPDCDGRECGDDGCGGTCGGCEPWNRCDGQGQCGNLCTDVCAGRQCGPDLCGGFCGTCAEGQACGDDGQCVPGCVPDCSLPTGGAKVCGSDGCGGACGPNQGQCPDGLYCAANGLCTENCLPTACGERQCGFDGCGGACGPSEGYCQYPLACTIDGQCGNWCTSCSHDPSCSDLGFEAGDFIGWSTWGDAHVVTGLFEVAPTEGWYMAMLGANDAPAGKYTFRSSEATFDDCLPLDVNHVDLDWRYVSAAFKEFCGAGLGNRVRVVVSSGSGTADVRGWVTVVDAGLDELCALEDCTCDGDFCGVCGGQYAGLVPTGFALGDKDDVWSTPWVHAKASLGDLVAQSDGLVKVSVMLTGDGDPAYQSLLLLDAIHFTVCQPQCDGRECGPDACDGYCGTFGGGCAGATDVCVDGLCCTPLCNTLPVATGDSILPGMIPCGPDGCGGSCGACTGPQDQCIDGWCECIPACEGKQCGDDGCGGDCWWDLNPGALYFCDAEGSAVCLDGACCQPSCLTPEGLPAMCGSDGCGGECGLCEGVQDACLDGVCVCQPDCAGRVCGDDGCGGFCGDLPEGACPGPQDVCFEGQCLCQPDCWGGEKLCGDDGCGGDCGVCGGAQDACVDGTCVCQPYCPVGYCGFDGCGGTCTCPGAQDQCLEGMCICQPDCWGGEKLCGDDGCGGVCGTCPGATDVCVSGACCTPDCADKECGPDFCGGSCGECPVDQFCDTGMFVCVPIAF